MLDFFLFLHKKVRGVFHLRAVIFSVVSFFVAVRSFFHLRTLLFPVPVLRRDFIRVSGADVIRETFYVFTSLANSFTRIKPVTVIQYMCFFSMFHSVLPGVIVDQCISAPKKSKKNGASIGIRTPNLLIRSQPLYPIELWMHIVDRVNAFNVSRFFEKSN